MRTYAAAQLIGGRSHQCDATATRTNPTTGTRAFAVLDGIGSSDSVREFTRNAAARLARSAARLESAEPALRGLMTRIAAESGRPDMWGILPSAAAIVAVHHPGHPLTIAWAGDCRAYHLTPGQEPVRLSQDHNMRRVVESISATPGPAARNRITSYLGGPADDEETRAQVGHPAVETAELADVHGRLILATDGAYEPLEDSCVDLAEYVTGTPRQAARLLVADAVARASSTPDNATCLVVDLP